MSLIAWGEEVDGIVAGAADSGAGNFQVYLRNSSKKKIALTFRELEQVGWSQKIILVSGEVLVREPAASKTGAQVTLLLEPGERFLIGHPGINTENVASVRFLLKQEGKVEVDGIIRPWWVNLETGEVPLKIENRLTSSR